MWTCKICDCEIEDDTWEACWHCSSPRNLESADIEVMRKAHQKKVNIVLNCLRCDQKMTHAGTRKFRREESISLTFLGFELTPDLLNHRYDVYVCTNCGKTEFFVDGIGDELRGERPSP